MKPSFKIRLLLLIQAALIVFLAFQVKGQSFYANRYYKGRTTQLNNKTVAQKKLTVYQKHSLLYKMRREIGHNKKRKNFKKGKTR